VATTVNGNECMNWLSQDPHEHSRVPDNYPGFGLGDHNYCRNPDGEPTIWCYTTDPNVRWEFCEVEEPTDCLGSNIVSGNYRLSNVEYLEDGYVQGRVEVNHDDEWGTVCDDSFTDVDAGVFCRSLGYSFDGAVHIDTYGSLFEEGIGPTWMDQMECTGDEESLEDCARNDWGVEDCSHSEDVGVICRFSDYTSSNGMCVGGIRDTYTAGGADDPIYPNSYHVDALDKCEARCDEDAECSAFTWYYDEQYAGQWDNCYIKTFDGSPDVHTQYYGDGTYGANCYVRTGN